MCRENSSPSSVIILYSHPIITLKTRPTKDVWRFFPYQAVHCNTSRVSYGLILNSDTIHLARASDPTLEGFSSTEQSYPTADAHCKYKFSSVLLIEWVSIRHSYYPFPAFDSFLRAAHRTQENMYPHLSVY